MTPGMHPLAEGLPEPWAVEWGEDRYGVFASFAIGEAVQRMRWVPPGRFKMGSPEQEAGRFGNEGPQHEVEISRGFWLADTPCTQALWQAVMGENPSDFVSPDRPVERVSWNDCQAFLEELNRLMPDFGARLPFEAEWEYACRAGTETATWLGDLEIQGDVNAPLLDAIAWYGGNSRGATQPVRGRRPNSLGLFDMLGNVWEWCADRYGPYTAIPGIDPTGPTAGSYRVYRGSSWSSYAWLVRAARRKEGLPERRYDCLGLRLARGQARSPVGPGAKPLAASERNHRPQGSLAERDGARPLASTVTVGPLTRR